MRKLILSGDDWFELKHTLELLVIAAHNEAEALAAAKFEGEEMTERAAHLAKCDREKVKKYKRLLALMKSAERLPDTKEETNG
jgi:hypothetical protein